MKARKKRYRSPTVQSERFDVGVFGSGYGCAKVWLLDFFKVFFGGFICCQNRT